MLPDDDMLKAFVADTMMKEEDQVSLPPPASAGKNAERRPDAGTPNTAKINPSSRLTGVQPVLGSILKWGLLILVVVIVWLVLSK